MTWKTASVWSSQLLSPQHGRTLLEMTIVVTLISLVAAVAVPSGSSLHLHRLNLSTSELAGAFRFSRDEARRTGVPHGVSLDVSANVVRVFRLDEAPDPNVRIFDIYHPVTKLIYAVQLDAPPFVGVSLKGVGGQLIGACGDPDQIAFDAHGVVRCSEPSTTRINNASVELTIGELSQSLTIDGYTGRVLVQ